MLTGYAAGPPLGGPGLGLRQLGIKSGLVACASPVTGR
jgi:hypothetical protein